MSNEAKTKEVLQKSRDLIKEEQNWVKSKPAMAKNGLPVNPTHPHACAWCASGAVERIVRDDTIVRGIEKSFVYTVAIYHLAQAVTEHENMKPLYDGLVEKTINEIACGMARGMPSNPEEVVQFFNDSVMHEDVLDLFNHAIEGLE